MTSMHVPNCCKAMTDGHGAISEVRFCLQELGNDLWISDNRRNLPFLTPGHKADPVVGVSGTSSLGGNFHRINQDNISIGVTLSLLVRRGFSSAISAKGREENAMVRQDKRA
jgi:hypothetical protein